MAYLQTHQDYKSALVPRAFWELREGVCVCTGLGVQNLDTKGAPAASDEVVNAAGEGKVKIDLFSPHSLLRNWEVAA